MEYLNKEYVDPWNRKLGGVDACTAEAFDPFRKVLIDAGNDPKKFKQAWETLMRYDWASTRAYLSSVTVPAQLQYPYPLSVVHWMETRNSGTGGYDRAFSEVSTYLSGALTLHLIIH